MSRTENQLLNYISDNIFLDHEWHTDDLVRISNDVLSLNESTSWRIKKKMKTVGVALVICLNIGIDPPDIIKPNPCARKECWIDPVGPKQKGLEFIGNALQSQYEKWHSTAKYKQCLDPTSEELRKMCINLRKSSRNDRLLFHYNGHGVPKPTKNGELWFFGKHYTHYTPVAASDLRSWLGEPTIYVLDCSGADVLISHLVDNPSYKTEMMSGGAVSSSARMSSFQSFSSLNGYQAGMEGPTIVLAACKTNEILPLNPLFPADVFTSCLTTPITIAVRWFILQNPYSMEWVNVDIADNIPGKDNDRKTPRGELNWIFTAITDTIAWNTLPSKLFQQLFRQDLLVASLFRNFLLAKRIMKSLNCTAQSWPLLPDSTMHHLWQAWDLTLESFLNFTMGLLKGSSLVNYRNNMSFHGPSGKVVSPVWGRSQASSLGGPVNSVFNFTFFTDQLTAFDLWLDFATPGSEPPMHLAIVLQVLMFKTHRLRALHLLKRYLALGPEAVSLSLHVGIFPYILKLLNSTDDQKQILISIWASIIGFDPSCKQQLVNEKSQPYFIQHLMNKSMSVGDRCMAAFVLAEICNGFKEGQQSCLQLGLHRTCTSILSEDEIQQSSTLKKWACLCLYKLCENFVWAKYLVITEAGHTQLYPLLVDSDPTVRAAAVLALGELFGASALSNTLVSGSLFPQSPRNTPGMMPEQRLGRSPSYNLSPSPMLHQQSSQSFHAPSSDFQQQRSMTSCSPFGQKDLQEAEIQLALQLLECCTDGCSIVRLESVYALSKFFVQNAHLDCVKIVAKSLWTRNRKKKEIIRLERQSVSPKTIKSSSPLPGAKPPHGVSKLVRVYPWHLNEDESVEITIAVEDYLVSQEAAQTQPSFNSTSREFMGFSGIGLDLSKSPSPQLPVSTGLTHGDYRRRLEAFPSRSRQGSKGDNPGMRNASPDYLSTFQRQGSKQDGGGSQRDSDEKEVFLSPNEAAEAEEETHMGLAHHPSTPSLPALMASAYVRLWLALTEVQGKDPHSVVAEAAGDIRYRMHVLLALEERQKFVRDLSRSQSDLAITHGPSSHDSAGGWIPAPSPVNYRQGRFLPGGGNSPHPMTEGQGTYLNDISLVKGASSHAQGATVNATPPFSPLGVVSGSKAQHSNLKFPIPLSASGSRAKLSESALFDRAHQPETHQSLQDKTVLGSGNNPLGKYSSESMLVEALTGWPLDISALDLLLTFHSSFYQLTKSMFLSPDLGYDPHHDSLSVEGKNRAYRNSKILEMLEHQKHLMSVFKEVEDRPEINFPEKKPPKGPNGGHSEDSNHSKAALTSLPPNLAKFEQKALLKMENAFMTSIVMFHAFQDILAVSDGTNVDIWSLEDQARLCVIQNKHKIDRSKVVGQLRRGKGLPEEASHPINTLETSIFSPLTSPRISSMCWINESYDALLLLGSDDGVVKVWRDVSTSYETGGKCDSDDAAAGNSHGGSHKRSHYSAVELASAFSALPDVAETSRGSGLVLSWQQATGTLIAGGNSSTIRVWDLGREQCVRVFNTGCETCLTTIAASTRANFGGQQTLRDYQSGTRDAPPSSWILAGFADGSIGVYDDRVGGRVHHAREHTSWIVQSFLRADTQEVITGSVRGSVKFWDIRTMRTHKTLEVQKSPLTAFTVHNCAPLIATGSHAQFIKILTLGGEQLGNIIKYYDGFLGQRIGAVTCLAFHPYKTLLAGSFTDSIVTVYGTEKSDR